MSNDEMNGDDKATLILGICVAVMLLSAITGAIVERVSDTESILWEVLILLSGIAAGITMIVTRYAPIKYRTHTGKEAVGTGVVVLVFFLSALICTVSGYLGN